MKRISTGKEAVVQVIGAGAPQIVCVGPLQGHLKYHKHTLEYSVPSMPCFLSQGLLTPCTLDRDCQDLQFTDTGKKDGRRGCLPQSPQSCHLVWGDYTKRQSAFIALSPNREDPEIRCPFKIGARRLGSK